MFNIMALLAEKLITSKGNKTKTTQTTWPQCYRQQRQQLPFKQNSHSNYNYNNVSFNSNKQQTLSKKLFISSSKTKTVRYTNTTTTSTIMNSSSWLTAVVVYLVAALTLLPLNVMANRKL